MLDLIKGYKTVVFNAFMAVVMVVRVMMPDVELPADEALKEAGDSVTAALAVFWAAGAVMIRAVTNSPIFKKKAE
jgi:hypothetical protein